MTDKEWKEKFLSLYPEAFRRVKEAECERPLTENEVVVWNVNGERVNDRALTILYISEGRALIEGYLDGQAQMPVTEAVPLEHVARAQEVFRTALEMGHEHGLCECHPAPAGPKAEVYN